MIELEPFNAEVERMEEIWHPYDPIYTDIGIPILSMYYRKFSVEMGLETVLRRVDLLQLLQSQPIYNDTEYEAAYIIFLVLQNLNWEVDRISFDDVYSINDAKKYIKSVNVEMYRIFDQIEEQIYECVGTDCIFYCLKNKKIGQYLHKNKNTNKEVVRILENLHPLFYQNSWLAKEFDGVYYIAFTIGLCLDAPITFRQIHPNFYNLAYAIDKIIDKEWGEESGT